MGYLYIAFWQTRSRFTSLVFADPNVSCSCQYGRRPWQGAVRSSAVHAMSKKTNYLGGSTVLTQSPRDFYGTMVRDAARLKRKARRAQEEFDAKNISKGYTDGQRSWLAKNDKRPA